MKLHHLMEEMELVIDDKTLTILLILFNFDESFIWSIFEIEINIYLLCYRFIPKKEIGLSTRGCMIWCLSNTANN